MFVTVGNMTQYVSDIGGQVLLTNPEARIASAHDAACCVRRLIYMGNASMGDANKDFNETYGRKTVSISTGNGACQTVEFL